MTDFAMSVFELTNARGFIVPGIRITYQEADTGAEWRIDCAGTRAYLVRFCHSGLVRDAGEQSADSHFIARRLTTALLLGGVGLFRAKAVGRILFHDVQGNVTWLCDLETRPTPEGDPRVYDWFQAISQHTVLRRAADDAYSALASPTEAFFFIYRGLEWIHTGLGVSWRELAAMLDVPETALKQLGKIANVETGVRHASRSGAKLRAEMDNATWVCGVIDAVNAARKRLEPGFIPMTPEEVSQAVLQAMSRPYA